MNLRDLAALLSKKGLKYAFGITGGGKSLKFIDELEKKGVTFINVSHESSAAIIAGASNRVKPNSNLEFGPFFFNMDSLNLYKNGLSIHLTTSEQNLLKCFAKMPNKALSRDDLNKMLGGKMEDRSIDVAITRIRKKIEKDQRFPTYLQTIRGFGWKLNTFNSKEFNNET